MRMPVDYWHAHHLAYHVQDYGVTVGVRETNAPSDESPNATTLASRNPTTELTYPAEIAPALAIPLGTFD